MFKVTIIEFTRHNCWGTSDHATHYYAGGRRIGQNEYYRSFCSETDMRRKGLVYDHTKVRTVADGNITKDYTEIFYKKAA